MTRERRRRFLIASAKIGLPLFALAVLGSLFLFNGARFDARISLDGVDPSDLSEGLRILNPRFTGSTAKGEPFTVTAASALPDGPRPERIELVDARGGIDLDGRRVEATAAEGVLLPRVNEVRLSGGVVIETSDGYRLAAPEAALLADEDLVTATGGVVAEGPMGRIEAERLRATRRDTEGAGAYIWFEERVKVRIDGADAQRG